MEIIARTINLFERKREQKVLLTKIMFTTRQEKNKEFSHQERQVTPLEGF